MGDDVSGVNLTLRNMAFSSRQLLVLEKNQAYSTLVRYRTRYHCQRRIIRASTKLGQRT